MFVNLVKFIVSLEYRTPLINALMEDGQNSLRDEPGTIRFDIIQDDKNPNFLFLYEVYKDEAAFEAHKAGPHYKRFMMKFTGMVTNLNGIKIIEELGRGSTRFPPDGSTAWQR